MKLPPSSNRTLSKYFEKINAFNQLHIVASFRSYSLLEISLAEKDKHPFLVFMLILRLPTPIRVSILSQLVFYSFHYPRQRAKRVERNTKSNFHVYSLSIAHPSFFSSSRPISFTVYKWNERSRVVEIFQR